MSVLFIGLAGFALRSSAFAEILLVRDKHIYKTNLKSEWFAQVDSEASLREILFLRLEKKGESYLFSPTKPTPLPSFTFLKKELDPKVPNLDGCGENPLEWLRHSKIIGYLKADEKSEKIYVEIPVSAAIIDKYSNDLPDALARILTKKIKRQPAYTAAEMIKTLRDSRVVVSKDNTFVYTFFDEDVNQSLIILQKPPKGTWILRHWLTLTDDCP